MKYGKNQWARVSSLLNRKSPKQCKARWYEWLDPSIKKTEWTREEEEKLLHLAKIFPNQWRTISPIVGRTASQCLEHYEKLLDQAQDRDKDLDITEDPRKLRSGEIDPNPEAKPARPDAIDLDDDEKEMLSEARARMANTQGKKEKRKAREKKLEEQRRIALLQKRRELKAAGIHQDLIEKKKKKPKGGVVMDYNKEVPFARAPVVGFYDVSEERAISKAQSIGIPDKTIRELDGKRKLDEIEKETKEEHDKKKKKTENVPEMIKQIEKANSKVEMMKRGNISLPSPQVEDAELEEVGKILSREDGEIDDSSVTNKLLTSHKATPNINVGRTPSTGFDHLRTEARNLATLNKMQTPLEGGANPLIDPKFFKGGMTPKVTSTPNVLVANATPKIHSTPIVKTNSVREERVRQEMIKQQLRDSIASLPKPTIETYHFSVKSLKPQQKDEDVMDEEDIQQEKNLAKSESERIALKKRSQVFQRELPIPTNFSIPKKLDEISRAIYEEMNNLIQFDRGTTTYIEQFKISELSGAKSMMQEESKILKQKNPITEDEFEDLWIQAFKQVYKSLPIPNAPATDKLENKLKVLTGGYVIRGKKLCDQIVNHQNEIYQLEIELESRKHIESLESQAIPRRIAFLKEEIEFQRQREHQLQQEYKNMQNAK